jgi:O-antigen/teichoic acid export membrane protein
VPEPAASVSLVTHRTARNVGLRTTADLVGKLGSFVFLIIGARELSQVAFGGFSYAFALAGIVGSILLWGFDPILIRDASTHPDDLSELMADVYVWRVIIGVPAFVIAGVIGALTRPSGTSVAALAFVLAAVFLDTLFATAQSGAQSQHRLGRVALAQLVNRLLTGLAGVVAIAAGFGIAGYSGAYLSGSIVGAIAILALLRPVGIRPDFSRIRRESFLALGRTSMPIGLDAIVAVTLFKADAILLGAIRGNEELATYTVAYRLLETGLFVAIAVVAAIFPIMSATHDLGRVRRAVERGFTVCAAVYVPFAVAAIMRGEGIIRFFFGSRYAVPAAQPFAWLAFAPLLIAYGNIANMALVARRHIKGAVLASIAAMIFNVLLNTALIPLLGPTGAAIATTAAYLFEAIILAVLGARAYGIARIDRAIAESAVAGVVMFSVLFLLHIGTILDLLVATAAYGVAWLGLSYRFSRRNIEVLLSAIRRGPAVEDSLPADMRWYES